MIAVARNISYGAAYTEYAAKKDRAVFVGSQNMVGDFGLVFDNRQLDDIWLEFKEAGADYVRKGKEVTRDLFVIESSPSSHESVNWSKQDWLDHAKELLEEIDKVSLKVPRKDKKTNKWILDENGKKKLFPVPKTKLYNSKWMAMLHKDSQSGILHLHIMASRFTTDGRLNNNFDIAKRAAQAAEVINQRHGWEQAMSIRQQHIDEINNVINGIFADMNGDEISWKDFETRVNATTYTDYKGKQQHYTIKLHSDDNGNVGYSVYRGKSKFTASELGQKMTHISLDDKKILKDVAYSVLRNMDGQSFNWNEYMSLMAKKGALISLKHDSMGNVVNYSVTYNGKQYNASQIGPKLTAKKIIMEWERVHNAESVRTVQPEQPKRRRDWGSNFRPLNAPVRYENVNIDNIERIVLDRLYEMRVMPGNIKITDKTELTHDLDYYLHSAVDYLNSVRDADEYRKQYFADQAYVSAQAAVEYARRAELDRKAQSQQQTSRPTAEEQERKTAVENAKKTLQEWCDSHKAIFSDEQENILGLGIGAKCIENGMSPWIDANMENAALELADEAVEGIGRAALRMTQLAGEILTGIAIPQDVSLGGGGGSHNDLPKKKDDDQIGRASCRGRV
mgnify:CR=1 FL=1